MTFNPHIQFQGQIYATDINRDSSLGNSNGTLEPVFGTSSGTIAEGSSISGLVTTSTQVIAGTGLTGGGPLSSNVTLSVSSTITSGSSAGTTALQPSNTGTSGHLLGYLDGNNTVSGSWNFTVGPTSTTASQDTNTTQVATTAFVIGQASSSTPIIDGTATTGTSLRYARADHVHPTDTSRVSTATNVIAGTGLTGGGALSANVILNVSGSIVSGAAAGATALQPNSNGYIVFPIKTVATLGLASSNTGGTAIVTDALTPSLGVAVVGGGTSRVLVNSDGTNWIAV